MSSGKVLIAVVICVALKENQFCSRPVKRVNAKRNTSTYYKGLEPLNEILKNQLILKANQALVK